MYAPIDFRLKIAIFIYHTVGIITLIHYDFLMYNCNFYNSLYNKQTMCIKHGSSLIFKIQFALLQKSHTVDKCKMYALFSFFTLFLSLLITLT